MLLKLKVEKREVAVAAERGEVEEVLGGAVRGDVGDCGDEEEKAVRSLRRELRGWRSWNLEEGIIGLDDVVVEFGVRREKCRDCLVVSFDEKESMFGWVEEVQYMSFDNLYAENPLIRQSK